MAENRAGRAELRVLAAHLDSAAGGNPDVRLLRDAVLRAGPVRMAAFSAPAALRERWDIVHFHWPEWCVTRNRSPAVTALDGLRLLARLRSMKTRGTRVVWTVHNIRPHEADPLRVVDSFVSAFSLLVDQVMCSSQTVLDQAQRQYPALRRADQWVVPLGHYRGVYPDDRPTRAQARAVLGLPQDASIVLSLGMVRPYKNLTGLLRCHRELANGRQDAMLLVAGRPMRPEYAEELRRESRDIASVRLDLRYIRDDEIQHYLRACNSVIVPTSLGVNSGSALLALSYDRPVLLPHRGSFIEMRENLGGEWVHTYEGGLRPRVLRRAFEVAQPAGSPALDEFHDWSKIGRLTFEAYSRLAARA